MTPRNHDPSSAPDHEGQSAGDDREGISFDEFLIGTTLCEQGRKPRGVHHLAPHHAICGSTRSGKNITVLIHMLLGLAPDTDLVCISEKCDLVNSVLGRYVDQRLFENPVSVRKFGARLGVDTRGITRVRYQRRWGRAMNFDAGFQSAFPATPYNFVADVRPADAGAYARLQALARGFFPDERDSKADKFWIEGPRDGFASVIGHQLTTSNDPHQHNLVHCAQLFQGVDPVTGQASPEVQRRLFEGMMLNSAMGGMIAKEGLALRGLMSSKTFPSFMKSVSNKLGWLLADRRLMALLTARPAFQLAELGQGTQSLAVFAQPPRGDQSTRALLRTFLEMLLMELQQRTGPSRRKLCIVLDELPQYGPEQLELVIRMLNVLGDLNVTCVLLFQSMGQLIDLLSESAVSAMLSACALQFLGCRDDTTAQWIVNRLGQTTIRRDGRVQVVDVVDSATVYRELAPDSPLQYFFPYGSGKAMKLYRPAMKDLTTGVGLVVRGLNWQGHYDEGLPSYESHQQAKRS